jgi:hypothetical protein
MFKFFLKSKIMKRTIFLLIMFCTCLKLMAQNIGIGTTNPTQKLDVEGNLKLSGAIMPGGNAGTAGQVLVSNGLHAAPVWQTLQTTGSSRFLVTTAANSNSAGRQGFNANTGSSIQDDSLDLGTVRYIAGPDFTVFNTGTVNNHIQIANDGLYHFEGQIPFFLNHSSTTLKPVHSLSMFFVLPAENTGRIIINDEPLSITGTVAGIQYSKAVPFMMNVYITAGAKIYFVTQFENLTNYPYSSIGVTAGGYISGYRISD